jgi:hypothetical protein
MTKSIRPLRLGLIAGSALTALTATSLPAQTADPAADAAPVLVTPPPVTLAPATTSAPPASAATTTAVPMATAPAASTATPVLNVPPLATAPAAPPPATQAPAVSAPRRPAIARNDLADDRASEAVSAPARAAPSRPQASARADSPPAPATRVATEPAAQPSAGPAAVAPPVVPEAKPAPAPAARMQAAAPAQTSVDEDVLPIAAVGGLVLLGLAGGAFALRRRRRYEEPGEAVATEPVGIRAEPAPEAVEGPRTAVPAGFDLSRFGRHVQAAYRGPTPDNPFLSLKRRLKRASFMDQRERMAAQEPAAPAPATSVDAATLVAASTVGHVTTRMPRAPAAAFRPAFQS